MYVFILFFNILIILFTLISSQLTNSLPKLGPFPNNLTSSIIIIPSNKNVSLIDCNSSYKGQSFSPFPVSPEDQCPSKKKIVFFCNILLTFEISCFIESHHRIL